MTEEEKEQFYKHFCTFTDGGVSVSFTSDTLKDEEGLGVTLDDFIDSVVQAERERLTEIIENKADEPPPYSADPENPLKHVYQNQGYQQALADIINLINKR